MNEGVREKNSEALVTTLEEAIARIQSGRLDTEEQVKLSVVLPILRDLGWDVADPDEFIPEYSHFHTLSGLRRTCLAVC